MSKYEVMFVVKTSADLDATVNKFSEVLKGSGASEVEVVDFNERELAYPIKKETKGHYYIYNAVAPSTAIDEMDRLMKIDNNILRHMAINIDEE